MNCWQCEPEARPSFSDLTQQLKRMENQHKVRLINKLFNKEFPYGKRLHPCPSSSREIILIHFKISPRFIKLDVSFRAPIKVLLTWKTAKL